MHESTYHRLKLRWEMKYFNEFHPFIWVQNCPL